MTPELAKRIVIIRATQHFATDSRIKKIARDLSGQGYEVTVLVHAKKGTRAETVSYEDFTVQTLKPVTKINKGVKLDRLLSNETEQGLTRLKAQHRSEQALRQTHIDELVLKLKLEDPTRAERIKHAAKVRWLRFVSKQKRRSYRQNLKKWKKRLDLSPTVTAESSWREMTPNLWDHELTFGTALDRLQPDLIIAENPTVLGVVYRARQRALANGRRIGIIADIRENWAGIPASDARTRRSADGLLSHESEYLSKFDAVVTVNEFVSKAMEERNPSVAPVHVVMNCPRVNSLQVPQQSLREMLGVEPDTPLLVHVGGISHARGLDVVIESLKHCPDLYLGLVTVPFPHPLQAELIQLAAEHGVAQRIRFSPPVDNDEIIKYLADADIGIVAFDTKYQNHREASPNKLFEYLHAGLPIVSSQLKFAEQLIDQTGFGAIFEYPNVQSCAAAINSTYSGLNDGRLKPPDDTILAEYSWENQMATMLRVVNDTLEKASN